MSTVISSTVLLPEEAVSADADALVTFTGVEPERDDDNAVIPGLLYGPDPTNIAHLFPALVFKFGRGYNRLNLSNTKKGPGRAHFQGSIKKHFERQQAKEMATTVE